MMLPRKKSLLMSLVMMMGLWNPGAGASRPVEEKSEEACEKLLVGNERARPLPFSSSTLIPLHTLLGSTRCDNVAKLWRQGKFADKRFPGPGLIEIFRTVEIAAESIIREMKITAVSPVYDRRIPLFGAEATLKLMESPDAPEYIRRAVLIRDGVLMVVPLLKRTAQKNGRGFHVYEPIIAKGHQDLQEFDILAAAFAGWALEAYQDVFPAKGFVYLRSMEKKRKAQDESEQNFFAIGLENYRARISQIHENFLAVITVDEKFEETGPRRCGHCNRCPWASHCRKALQAKKDLSLLNSPPRPTEQAILEAMGLTDLTALSKLSLNSPLFVTASVTSGIVPSRLLGYKARAMATELGRPLIVESFDAPVEEGLAVAHIDFEDFLTPEMRSGVYLFGIRVDPVNKGSRKSFTFAKELEQGPGDEAWAEFIRILKTERSLKDRDYAVTVYSKHERVKFEQQFDILKQAPSQFTPQQRSSPYYWQTTGDNGRPIGRLIREKYFFKKFPDISPDDVFSIMGRMIDLLSVVKKQFAFPGYSNSIKAVLPYMQDDAGEGERLEFPESWNGLNSLGWARQAYSRHERRLFDKIEAYNAIDIDANAVVLSFLQANAGQEAANEFNLSIRTKGVLPSVKRAALFRGLARDLSANSELFRKTMGRAASELGAGEMEELAALLDRHDYLGSLKDLKAAAKKSNVDTDAKRQMLRFEFVETRSTKLREFFQRLNPDVNSNPLSEAAIAQEQLLKLPSNVLTPRTLFMLAAFESFQGRMPEFRFRFKSDPRDDLEAPEAFKDFLLQTNLPSHLRTQMRGDEFVALAEALFLSQRFPIATVKVSTNE